MSATTLVPADFAVMARESQLIVHGRVVDVHAQAGSGSRTIESVIRVSVVDDLKGGAGREVVFRVPGGQLGRYRRVMVGAPAFAYGDEVVLFLKGRAPVVPMPYGLNQGVYRVARNTGAPLVTPPVAGTGRVVRGDPARHPIALGEFVRQVREAAGTR